MSVALMKTTEDKAYSSRLNDSAFWKKACEGAHYDRIARWLTTGGQLKVPTLTGTARGQGSRTDIEIHTRQHGGTGGRLVEGAVAKGRRRREMVKRRGSKDSRRLSGAQTIYERKQLGGDGV